MNQARKNGEGRLPQIEVGDTIIARHVVTHANVPGAVCGVKISDMVIGFSDSDIIEVLKRPIAVGDLVFVDTNYHTAFDVRFVDGDYALVRPFLDRSVPPAAVEVVRLTRTSKKASSC